MPGDERVIIVTGATGRQGGAVSRHLLAEGWRVRGVTRSPDSKAARELAALGVQMVKADMADPEAMGRACAGMHGVSHLVYGSAGPGMPGTGVAAEDLGAIAARAFADPASYVGADLALAAELCSVGECRTTWRRVTGRNPRRFPMPVWLSASCVRGSPRRIVAAERRRRWPIRWATSSGTIGRSPRSSKTACWPAASTFVRTR